MYIRSIENVIILCCSYMQEIVNKNHNTTKRKRLNENTFIKYKSNKKYLCQK